MDSDEDEIQRAVDFDELLRTQGDAPLEKGDPPEQMNLLRLLHEVLRGAPASDSTADSAADSEPGAAQTIPDRIGRFRITRLLGQGGFGIVYLAEDPLLNRLVALKVIHSHRLLDPTMRRRALREREAMARLQHPNIIPVLEASEDGERLFIVSEYCAGQTLAQWLASHRGPLEAGTVAQWTYRLVDAVAHSHQRGVIHRDIKPGNILLDKLTHLPERAPDSLQSLEPRLSDFGLAKILEQTPSNNESILTQDGSFVGSLEYASPEQVRALSNKIGPATDVYALGVLLFQLLTGRLPHVSESRYDLERMICEVDAKFPRSSAASIPRDLQAITLRAMARDLENRYASAEDLRDDLGRYLHGQPVSARHVSRLELLLRVARKRPVETLLIFACVLITLLFCFSLYVSNAKLAEKSQELERALKHSNAQTEEADHQRDLAKLGQESLNKIVGREALKHAFEQLHQQNYVELYHTLRNLEDKNPPHLEWHFLQQQLANSYFTFDLQDLPVQALAWHSADQQVVTISESGQLRRWGLESRTSLSNHQIAVGAHSLAVHPDGQTLALPKMVADTKVVSATDSKSSRVGFWDWRRTVQIGASSNEYSTTVESIEYSPDGRWLAVGPRYGSIVVTELETRESFAITSERRNRHVRFSNESDRVAVYGSYGTIEIRELNSRNLVSTIHVENADEASQVFSMAWLPRHNALLVNSDPARLRVYSAQDGRQLADIHAGIEAETLAISTDGLRLALGSHQGFVKVFDIDAVIAGEGDKAALTANMRLLSGQVTDIAFVDEHRFVAADEEGNMILWSPPVELPSLIMDGYCEQLHWQDDQNIMACHRDGTGIHMLNLANSNLTVSSVLPPHVDREVARTQYANHRAMASFDGKISIVDLQTGASVSCDKLPTGTAVTKQKPVSNVLQFSSNGKLLFTTGENNHLCAIRVADGEIAWTNKLTNTGRCLAEDATSHTLFVGGGFEPLRAFDIDSGNPKDDYLAGNGTSALLILSARNELISGHKDGSVRQRNLLKMKTRPAFHLISTSAITAMAGTKDGRTLIVGDQSGVLRVTDGEIALLGVIYRSSLIKPEVVCLKWSPNHQRLAALIRSSEQLKSEIVILESGTDDNAQ